MRSKCGLIPSARSKQQESECERGFVVFPMKLNDDDDEIDKSSLPVQYYSF